jgi:hypothetical protein
MDRTYNPFDEMEADYEAICKVAGVPPDQLGATLVEQMIDKFMDVPLTRENVRGIIQNVLELGIISGYGIAQGAQEQLADATREPVAASIERTDAAEMLFTATVERRALTLAQQKLIRTFAERVARDENHGVLSAPIMGRAIEDVIG